MKRYYKPITKFETVVAKKGKKKIYVGAYADEKTPIRIKTHISEFVPRGTTLQKGE